MPPVRFKLNTTERINFQQIPIWVFKVSQELIRNKFQAYLVGGAVRDLLWGKQPNDWDLATDALPEQVAAMFPNAIPTGKKFGSMTVLYESNAIEVTTLREDLVYYDGRHPENVRFSKDICTDLARRDFTINALAYDFLNHELIDPFTGKKDLHQRLLKAIEDPSRRFNEDGLRMFRFYRFLATLELRAHRPTERAVNPNWIVGVSSERIREEFSKLLLGKDVGRGLKGLRNSGLLESFIPEFTNKNLQILASNHNNLWQHLLNTTVAINPQLHLRLAAFLHDVAKPLTRTIEQNGVHFYGHDELGAELGRTILERLRYPGKLIDAVTNLIRWHMFFINEQTSDGAIRRLIVKVGPKSILDLMELRRADIIATGKVDYHTWESWRDLLERITQILNNDDNLSDPFHLVINGDDLIKQFQLSPGPFIGEILDYLKDLILDEPALNQKSNLLKLAKDYIYKKGD